MGHRRLDAAGCAIALLRHAIQQGLTLLKQLGPVLGEILRGHDFFLGQTNAANQKSSCPLPEHRALTRINHSGRV
jgi:hypothetical protein